MPVAASQPRSSLPRSLGRLVRFRRYGPASIYARVARQSAATRNPVVVLPGILGSRLADPVSGRVLWGGRREEFARQDVAEEARLLAHPMEARPS